jgi:phage tail-like protein
MAVGDRNDPFRGYNYRVEIDNVALAGFSEASGLTFDIDQVEYREGNDLNMHVRKLSGLRKFSNIVLKRGFTTNMELFNWYLTNLNGSVERRNGSVVVQDEDRADVLRFNFSNGWICKYEGPTLNATSNDVIVESIEICVERVELEAG